MGSLGVVLRIGQLACLAWLHTIYSTHRLLLQVKLVIEV